MDAKREEVRQRCIEVLLDLGASKDFSQFYADVLQCEYDITYSSYALHKEIRETNKNGSPLYATIQKLAKSFNSWRVVVQTLSVSQLANRAMRADDAPKFSRAQTLKAVCSLETNEVKLNEGDEMIITDASQPNQLKVRTPKGEEGYVPALSCVLPVPDGDSLHAIERLEIQLLTSWTESVARLRPILHQTLTSASTDILTQWANSSVRGRSAWQERVSRRMKRIGDIFGKDLHSNGGGVDLNRLHKTLTSLENELTWQGDNGLSKLIETISNIDKTILCYQAFRKQLQLYRKSLRESARPIRIVNWDPKAFEEHAKSLKYFEVKWTAEEVLTKEESVYLNANQNQQETKKKKKEKSELDQFVGGSKREKVSAEEIVSRSHEENKRFFVRSVVDPRGEGGGGEGGGGGGGRLMSIKDAVAEGIVDHAAGLYVNPLTGESKTISAAMAEGLIQVDYATTTTTDEKVESIGLITIRTQTDNREYTITGAIDTRTCDHLDADEARRREAIDEATGEFVDLATGTRFPLDEAIDRGWVFVHYDDSASASAASAAAEFETKTYAISAVVDQAQRRPVPFVEAIRRGLIDRQTGNYVNNVTGDRVFAAEAIRRGFFKSVVVEDPTTLNIDATNRVVVERIERVRKNVLRGVRVISAFSRALKAAATPGAQGQGADRKTEKKE